MADCSVCCKNFTYLLRQKVDCINKECNYKVCRECVGTYLLGIVTEPKCMNCSAAFTYEFLGKYFKDTFFRQFKEHRKKILFERERCMFPETMPIVENILNKKENRQAIKDVKIKIEAYLSYNFNDISDDKILKHVHRIRELNEKIINPYEIGKRKNNTPKFIRPCPVNDCRGILSNELICGICSVKACDKCYEIKHNDDHVCDPNTIETINALKKDSKHCPKCSILIYKSSGCLQMWCTQCHTTFNWDTLEIEHGNIHNPHYFEWAHNNAVRQNECNNNILPSAQNVVRFCRNSNFPEKEEKKLLEYLQLLMHIDYTERRKVQTKLLGIAYIENTTLIDYKDVRIKYLTKKISEKVMKDQLYIREVNREKYTLYLQLYVMLYNCGRDLFQNLIHGNNPEILAEFDNLFDYYKKCKNSLDNCFRV